MICLVYVSSATRLFEPAALEALLAECRSNNAAADITGMLMYADGNILQTIEGKAAAVGDLFSRIERDPRHRQVFKLYQRSIDRRQFGRWSMALAQPERLGAAEGVESIAVLRNTLSAPGDSAAADGVRTLLKTFANNMR